MYGYFKSKDELTKVPAGSVNQQLVLAHGTCRKHLLEFVRVENEFFETYEK